MPDLSEQDAAADATADVNTTDEALAAESAGAGPVKPAPLPDEVLIAAVDVAREALAGITPRSTVGEPAGHVVVDDHVVSLLFANTLPGYPGWFWTVTLSRTDGDALPNVLETELMPGDGALLAPAWTPWSERLADYRAAQEAAAAAAAEAELEDADLDEDDADLDDADFDEADLDDENVEEEDLSVLTLEGGEDDDDDFDEEDEEFGDDDDESDGDSDDDTDDDDQDDD